MHVYAVLLVCLGWCDSSGLANIQNNLTVYTFLDRNLIQYDHTSTDQIIQPNENVILLCNQTDLTFIEYSGRQLLNCSISYLSNPDEVTVYFSSDNPFTVQVVESQSSIVLPPSPVIVQGNICIPLQVGEIGEAHVRLQFVTSGNETTAGVRLLVLRAAGILELVFRIGLILLLCLTTFLMGCEVEIEVMRNHLRRPIGLCIGFACQFVLMPGIAFGLAKLAPVNPAFGFGLFLAGCCPGGGASNVWTKLLGGDLGLSLCMTLFSSLAALGMLPLLLFLFGRYFISFNTTNLPFGPIIINLIYLVIPLCVGLLIRWRRPTWADRLKRGVRPISFIFLIYVIGFGSFVNLSIYRLIGRHTLLLAFGAALPLIGFVLGGLIAIGARRPWPVVTAISVETGVQNVGVAILLLLYAIPQPGGDLGAVMPIIVALATPPLLLCAFVGRELWSCCQRKQNSKETSNFELENTSSDASF